MKEIIEKLFPNIDSLINEKQKMEEHIKQLEERENSLLGIQVKTEAALNQLKKDFKMIYDRLGALNTMLILHNQLINIKKGKENG